MITLCFIAHRRQHHLKKICEQLYNIEDDLKKNLSIKVLNDQFINQSVILSLTNEFKKNNINFENVIINNPTYYNKCVWMSKLNSEYLISCDEDIYMSTVGWNVFLKDAEKVNWSNGGIYAPIISSGIPSVELFLNLFVDEDSRKYFRKEFSKVEIPNLWGVMYDHLKYDPIYYENFYDQVYQIKHHYKGMHPLRVDMNLQNLFVDYVLQNKYWMNPIQLTLFPLKYDEYPYFCNSVYMIKTSFYKEVIDGIESQKYIFDGFEEVALNQHLKQTGKFIVFNKNCAAIHPSYNTIGMCYDKICDKFFENI